MHEKKKEPPADESKDQDFRAKNAKQSMHENNLKQHVRGKRQKRNAHEKEWEISQEILDAARGGDEEAFETLYKYSYPKVSVTVKTVIKNQDRAQDVIQEAYLRAFRELKKLKSTAGFVAWICRIAHNCAVDEASCSEEIPFSEMEDCGCLPPEPEDFDVDHLPEKACIRKENAEEVQEILKALPQEQWEVAELYYLKELSVQEIARYLSVSRNTVKSRLYYARKKIHRHVEEREKQGIKLRALPPFAFLAAIFNARGLCEETVPSAPNAIRRGQAGCQSHGLPGGKMKAGGRCFKTVFVRSVVSVTTFSVVVCTTSFAATDHQGKMPDYAYLEETEDKTEDDIEEETEGKTEDDIEEKTEDKTEDDIEEDTEDETEDDIEEDTEGKTEENTENDTEEDTEDVEDDTEKDTETEAKAGRYANVLRADLAYSIDHEHLFGEDIDRTMIRTVTFLSQVKDAPADAADVSYGRDRTVLAWVEAGEDSLYDMYIASSGAVLAPESCEQMFGYMTNLISIEFGDSFDTSGSKSTRYMFYNCTSLETLDVSGFDTSNVMDMTSMFSVCTSLESIELGALVTPTCSTIEAMFYKCSSLESIDVSSFDTENVISFSLMFAYCSSLTEVDLSSFDTSRCTSFWQMFCGCESIRELDLTMFDTANAEDMGEMFTLCYALESVDVSSFDTSNVTTMEGMFFKCTSLKELDLRSFNTAKVEDMSYMFSRSTALEQVEITEFETESLCNITHMFFETPENLKDAFRSWVDAIDSSQLQEAEDVFGSEEE